ncbi:adenylate kinase 9-like [Manduca sexta]|uniref:adenylate kinase 9-like n=1 Tax=Manduca sexta TaxID=7130 RepID=UPI001182D7D6|nr:adenylate kinase 9-like [Manduca sexta]
MRSDKTSRNMTLIKPSWHIIKLNHLIKIYSWPYENFLFMSILCHYSLKFKMFEFYKYKNNLDLVDKFGIQGIDVDKSVVYQGPIDLINKQIPDDKNVNFPPMGATFVGLNNTAAPLSNKSENHCWTDIDAQEDFLMSKPTCYLILGKPGSGCYSLGEALSKRLKCVHLCPKNIILDEIDQKSTTGNALDFNFKHNKVCKYDIILTLLKKKLISPAVKHRGYVISGFPMLTSNRDTQYFFESLFSEESLDVMEEFMYDLICNLKKKKPKQKKAPVTSQSSVSSDIGGEGEDEPEEEQVPEEEEVLEEQEPPVELPKYILDSCSNIISYKKSYYDTKQVALIKQFQEIIDMAPDIIIYITCPDVDLVAKKSHKYFNYISNQHTFEPFTIMKEDSEIRWPAKYTISDYTSPFDSHIFNSKYSCRQPFNFKNQSIEQMCNYKKCILSYIEEKIKDFDSKVILKLDGRTSTHEMMHHVMERLVLLVIKPVLIPEPLYLEEAPEDLEEFWKLVDGLNVIQSDVVHFNRYMSPWFNRCPVELKNRQSVQGKPKFAVMFFKHVYLLSSLGAMISFCRNPRPYLKLKYLEPTCRVIIIGTKLSGKTMISECLSWIFDAPVFCYKKFLEEEREKKYNIYAKSILSEIIATIEDARLVAWQNAELERYRNLDMWYESTEKKLNEYIPLLEENIKYTRQQKLYLEEERISELEVELEDKSLKTDKGFKEEMELDEDFWESFNSLLNKLNFLPFLDDIEKCKIALLDRTFLSRFAPVELLTVKEKPGIPMLGDEDVTNAISTYIIANDLQKEIEPSTEELVNEIIRIIGDIDMDVKNSTNAQHCYGKYIIDGFPSDPEYWGHLIDSNFLPDYTISLFENKEIDDELAKHYVTIEKSLKNYAERFAVVDDPLIKIKLLTTKIPDSHKIYMQQLVNDSINNTLNTIQGETTREEDRANLDTSILTSLTESVEKFREDWDTLKLKIEENSKSIIDIQLESKSDLQIIQEVLTKLRTNYSLSCEANEEEETEVLEDEDEIVTDDLTYNNPKMLCETSTYCPVAYYDYKVLWEGKPEFCFKYNNKIYYFCKEECSLLFQNDPTKYQCYNQPFKKMPSIRICVVGSIGSGKSTLSKYIAKELGLLHIDFEDAVNDYLMPRNFKKIGRRYENIFTDIPIDDEAAPEFHIDEENEDQVFDILSNEAELRRMIYNYFERGSAMIPALMHRLIKKIWFQNPFVMNGFVLDGYPRLPTDIEDMVTCLCIPDIIITLESSAEKSLERVSTRMFKIWKNQLNEAKNVAKMKLDREKKEWMNIITKNVVVKLIYDEVIDKSCISTEEPVKGLSAESVIIDAHPSGSSNVDANLFNTYNEMIQNLPEPTDQSVWEKPTDARERIDARVESIYEVDDENIQTMKDTLLEQKIKFVSIDATKNIDKVLRVALLKIKNVRNRNSSFFEQTFIVDTDIAEILLAKGFFFLSKFNRICPVHIFENPKNTVHPYKINKKRSTVFPVVHRCYIYFICGAENVRKFRSDPLKYIISDAIKLFYDYPLRISVIGGPKSGKSSLADKLSKRYGLICISRGKSMRQILENFGWTELGAKMIKALQEGEKVNFELIVKAIQTVAIDHRTTTSGYVFDGFPDSPSEALELTEHGLYPCIIFDISSTKDKVLQNSQNEIYLNVIKLKPPYSASFIDFRYEMFKDNFYAIREWIQNDFQNLYSIDGTKSKWQCLQDADVIITSIVPKIHYYLSNENNNVVPVDVMCISNAMFEKMMTNFKDMCPLCLRKNVFKCSGYPVNKKGVVRFKNRFYWICADHMDSVLKDPHCYLTQQKIDIPEIPAVIKTIHRDRVYENGVCIVTYAENLPAQKIEIGSRNFAASFKGYNYLFCSERCLLKFLAKPHMFSDITVFKETKLFPPLPLKNLPDLGYLEQTVGIMLTDACCALNVARPKYPGLSIQLSGLLFVALYLKTHNPLREKSALELYEQVFKTFEARSNLIKDVGLRLRSMDNPFAKYPRCCNRGKKIAEIRKVSSKSSDRQIKNSSSTGALTAISD